MSGPGRYERAEWVRDQVRRPLRRLLDVGGHDGAGAALFAGGAGFAVCADVDLEALRRGRAAHPGVRFVAAGGAALPFAAGSFDVLTCVEVLEHVPEGSERATLEELRRVAAPGAQLILTTPHAGWFAWLDPMDFKPRLRRLLGRRDKGHKHFRLDEIEALLAGLFAVERVYRNSLLLHPLSTALGKLDRGGLTRLRERMSDWDWAHDFGRASFNLAVVASALDAGARG